MKLQKVFGNTYFIKGGTNTGVYLFENKEALLIDPGLSGLRPKNMINMFENEKIIPKYIVNTHEHEDHVGASGQIKNAYPEIEILASEDAKLFMERPELFSDFILGGRHNKFLTEKLFHRNTEKISVDTIICEGKLQKNGVDFEVINLKGHTSGSIGILTPDGVLFAGDLLIGEETLQKYDFLFLQDVGKYLKSLDVVEKLNFDYLVLAHGKKVLDKKDTILSIEKHRQAVYKYLDQIIENLKVPMNIETLLKKIIKENELTYNYKEYYFFRTSLVSCISYLADLDKIDYTLEDSDLLYYTKIK
ncbi:MBL fold metallo-hydrolase [Intestinibacter bartlettii]|uniref:MBL fold metallo-hydrolase n=1 Tax=Intestinibacter bartlettii TaxID=261299 RepID=A0ABS6DW88_9FIRM|nr:MBL fold metallo-hydrolase [Intestinibacter bartlettii]MBU5336069.1 MBL fold metallo-hydrolase [Intestinibacter bartlettii]